MHLSEVEVERVLALATSYLDRKREPGFKCVEFVCQVYEAAGIQVPDLVPTRLPPPGFCLSRDELVQMPPARPIFLRNKTDWRPRKWTHMAISMPDQRVIHCSYFFGMKVVITPLEEILARYDLVESAALVE